MRSAIYHSMTRAVDIAASAAGLLIFAPIGAVIATAIAADSPGPVFYRGLRVGRGGRPFRMLKFRTMVPDADQRGSSVSRDGDERVTRVGKFLRWSKLDELPQLWNVLKGEMSLVGPRPDAPEIIDTYTTAMKRVLDARPGMTSVASLWLRNESELLAGLDSPDEVYMSIIVPAKVALAMRHLERRSLLFDGRILFSTVAAWVGLHRPTRNEEQFLEQLTRRIEASVRDSGDDSRRNAR